MEKLNICQLIGEATEYDKKQALEVKKPKSWCKSVSAFANGIGGKLVWGIADDDTLVGLADAKGDAEKISETIKTHLDPIPDFNLSFAKAEGKNFVVLDVLPGGQTPYYYIGDGQMQAFVRVGKKKRLNRCPRSQTLYVVYLKCVLSKKSQATIGLIKAD